MYVGTNSGELQPWEPTNPVTRTMSSCGWVWVRMTSMLVT